MARFDVKNKEWVTGQVRPDVKVFRAKDLFQDKFPLHIDRVRHTQTEFQDGIRRTRDFWKIVHVLEGEGESLIGEEKLSIHPRSTLLIHPGDPTTYRIKSTHLGLYNVLFTPDLFEKVELDGLTRHFSLFSFLRGTDIRPEEKMAFHLEKPRDLQLPRLFEDLESEYKNRLPLREPLLRSRMVELLLRLAREAGARQKKLRTEKLADYIDHLIGRHFSEELRLDDLSMDLGLDKSYLGRVYKRQRGRTIFDTLHLKRIDEAKELLLGSRLSVTDVGMESGFNDLSFFHKVFRELVGMTPKRFRERGRS